MEEEDSGVELRRAERRRMSSRSGVGRVAGVFVADLDFDVDVVLWVGGAERSRVLSAFRRSWGFAA